MHDSRILFIAIAVTTAGLVPVGNSSLAASRNPFVSPAGWTGLLMEPAVQKHLGMSDKQVSEIKRLVDKLSGDPDEVEKAIRIRVMGEQLARIEQLNWQREGGYALFDPKVSMALAITERQQRQLADAAAVNAAEHAKMRDFMARARFRSREAMEQYVESYHKPANERLLVVLSKDQQAKLNSLLGQPLTRRNSG